MVGAGVTARSIGALLIGRSDAPPGRTRRACTCATGSASVQVRNDGAATQLAPREAALPRGAGHLLQELRVLPRKGALQPLTRSGPTPLTRHRAGAGCVLRYPGDRLRLCRAVSLQDALSKVVCRAAPKDSHLGGQGRNWPSTSCEHARQLALNGPEISRNDFVKSPVYYYYSNGL